jgi:hypothetical protein
MKKFIAPIAIALAAFAAAGTAPAFAQSSGWSAGIQARNARPFVPAAASDLSGYSGARQDDLYNSAAVSNTPWTVNPNPWGSAAARGNSR